MQDERIDTHGTVNDANWTSLNVKGAHIGKFTLGDRNDSATKILADAGIEPVTLRPLGWESEGMWVPSLKPEAKLTGKEETYEDEDGSLQDGEGYKHGDIVSHGIFDANDRCLAAVGSKYRVVQAHELANLLDGVGLEWERIRTFGHGRKLSFQGLLPTIEPVKGDEVERRVFAILTHGYGTLKFVTMMTELWCLNQYRWALRQALKRGGVQTSIRHVGDVLPKVQEVINSIAGVEEASRKSVTELYTAAQRVQLVTETLTEFVNAVWPVSEVTNEDGKRVEAVRSATQGLRELTKVAFEESPMPASAKGTLLGAWKAVTYVNSHWRKHSDNEDRTVELKLFGQHGNQAGAAEGRAMQYLYNRIAA